MKKLIILSAFVTLAFMAFTAQPTFNVSSAAFTANGAIPAKYSCEGAEVSPPLTITGIPAGAKSLAIIVHDPDAPKAGGVTHWVAWNLPATGNIPENFKGAQQGLNSDNKPGYKGMCPPDGTHHYYFMVYALDSKLSISSQTDKAGLEKAMEGHTLAQAELIGLYTKALKQ